MAGKTLGGDRDWHSSGGPYRTPCEYFRLKHAAGEVITLSLTEHFLRGGLIGAGCLGRSRGALIPPGNSAQPCGMVGTPPGLLLGNKSSL